MERLIHPSTRMMMISSRGVLVLLLLQALLLAGAQESNLESDRQFLWLFLRGSLPPGASGRFNTSSSPCLWPGIKCRGDRVTEVDLHGTGLSSSIPGASLGKLDALESLDLSSNSISGSIPDDLWNLSFLRVLNLSSNLISGSLSSSRSFSQCPSLQLLDLSRNQLSGSIPDSLGHLAQLQLLSLASNRLQEIVPQDLTRLHYLRLLDLSSNQLSGPFPRVDGLRKLEHLEISHNSFTGRIAAGALRIPALKTFSARGNRFVGNIPVASTKQGGNLSLIDLGGNHLSGNIPPSVWGLNSLEVLRLEGNKLEGVLPDQVGAVLRFLDLSMNELSGSIEGAMNGGLKGLVFLELSSNRFSGKLPEGFTGFPRLVHLGLGNNPFSESRFPRVRELRVIEYLNLSAVQLIGPIPGPEVGELRTLKQLDLSHNELNESIPASIGDLEQLESLDLSFNNLIGSIPGSLRNLRSLRSFNASYNDLSGEVPDAPFVVPASLLGNKKLCGRLTGVGCKGSPLGSDGHPKKRRLRSAVLVGIITGSMAAAVALVACFFCCRRLYPALKKKGESPKEERYISMSGPFSSEMDPSVWASGVREPQTIPAVMFEKPLMNLTFSDILHATMNFSKEAQLPDSGSGPLFQGVLPGGMHVTVMVLGEGIPLENAAAHLAAIGRLKHPNLAPFLGYCMVGVERLLIHEFVQDNGDLYGKLHELPEGVQNTEDWSTDTWEHGQDQELRAPPAGGLNWSMRHKVALGTARALAFLHHGCHPPVVHGAVKASNVLLDGDLEPRLAGIGLRQLVEIDSSEPGYVAPELAASTGPPQEMSPKADVYAFGVLLLELATGKRPLGDDYNGHHGGNVVQWTRSLIKEKRGFKALDAKVMRGEEDIGEMLEALRVAYLCTADAPAKRPTMQQVVGLLKDLRPSSNSGEVWGSF